MGKQNSVLSPDFTGMTLNGEQKDIRYVESNIFWKSENTVFKHIIENLGKQPCPGFFLTRGQGDARIYMHWELNRHGILSKDVFFGNNTIYRDVDAKGIGFHMGYPSMIVPVMRPFMQSDTEARGILPKDGAIEDRLVSEDLNNFGIRVARHVANIELIDLIDNSNNEGLVVPRYRIGKPLSFDFDNEHELPTIAIRAMGTSARVSEVTAIQYKSEKGYDNYVKNIVEDATRLVSKELNGKLNVKDYVFWFIDTISTQLGLMHKHDISPDFSIMIHQGQHNVTLDSRMIDTSHYDTPRKREQDLVHEMKGCKDFGELETYFIKEMEGMNSGLPNESNNNDRVKEMAKMKVQSTVQILSKPTKVYEAERREDRMTDVSFTYGMIQNFVKGISKVYPLNISLNEIDIRMVGAYNKSRA